MTKSELIAHVAEETGLTKVASKEVIDTIINQIVKTLKKEGRFALFGLGILKWSNAKRE